MPFSSRYPLTRLSTILLVLLAMTCVALRFTRAADPDSLEEKPVKGPANAVTKAGEQGRYTFELDGVDGKPIEQSRFVRGIPGQFSVAEFPRSFALEGHAMFEAGRRLDSQLAAGGVTIFCERRRTPMAKRRDMPACAARTSPPANTASTRLA